jgi:hypothetical protein
MIILVAGAVASGFSNSWPLGDALRLLFFLIVGAVLARVGRARLGPGNVVLRVTKEGLALRAVVTRTPSRTARAQRAHSLLDYEEESVRTQLIPWSVVAQLLLTVGSSGQPRSLFLYVPTIDAIVEDPETRAALARTYRTGSLLPGSGLAPGTTVRDPEPTADLGHVGGPGSLMEIRLVGSDVDTAELCQAVDRISDGLARVEVLDSTNLQAAEEQFGLAFDGMVAANAAGLPAGSRLPTWRPSHRMLRFGTFPDVDRYLVRWYGLGCGGLLLLPLVWVMLDQLPIAYTLGFLALVALALGVWILRARRR